MCGKRFPRLQICQKLDFDLGLESWLSFQEVLFLSFFYKQWKRDLKNMFPDSLFHCKHCAVYIHSSGFRLGLPKALFWGRIFQRTTLFGFYSSIANCYPYKCVGVLCKLLHRVNLSSVHLGTENLIQNRFHFVLSTTE